MNKKSKLPLWVLIGLIVSGFSIFYLTDNSNLEPQTITIGVSNSLTSVLLTIADEKKFFEKEGLNVSLRWYKSAGDAFDDMLTGNIHMAGVSETPIMYKTFSRMDFKIFATVCTNSNDPKIIMMSNSGPPNITDLVGKKIGTTKKGQSAHFFLSLFLLKNNIGEDRVTIIHDSPSAIIDHLAKGDIHAASLFEPYVGFAKRQIKEKAFVFQEPGLYSKTFNLVAKTKYLNAHHETSKGFLKALIAAESFVINYPEKFLEIISRRHKVEKISIENYLSNSSLEVSLHASLLQTLKDEAKWAISTKLTDKQKAPDFSNIIFPDSLKAVRPECVTINQ